MSEKFRPIINEGTHLASSKEIEGTFLGALLDNETNKVVGQAKWELIPEGEDSGSNRTAEYLLLMLVGAAAAWGVSKAAPHIKRFWQETAAPGAKKLWAKITRKEYTEPTAIEAPQRASEIAVTPEQVTDGITQRLDEAYDDYAIQMSSEEAQKELIEIFLISAVLVSKINRLSNANITDEVTGKLAKGQVIADRLQEPQFLASVNQILARNPALLEKGQTATMEELFGRVLTAEGEYVPISTERFRDALALDLPKDEKTLTTGERIDS